MDEEWREGRKICAAEGIPLSRLARRPFAPPFALEEVRGVKLTPQLTCDANASASVPEARPRRGHSPVRCTLSGSPPQAKARDHDPDQIATKGLVSGNSVDRPGG